VHTSFLDKVPGARRHYPRLLPFMNAAFESFDLSDFDLVVSSNHACAKNVRTRPGTVHLCYCYTPMRYAWEPNLLDGEEISRMERILLPRLIRRLRRQDELAAQRPDQFVAISNHVAARIEKYYRRDARVIYPPVEVDRFLAEPRREGDYYLYLGRLVPYKRADVAAAACTALGRPLKIVGTGRGEAAVRDAAGPDVEILGHVPDDELPALLAGAKALLFPGEEDFGIVPVEAQAAGVPVIAYGVGGVLDSLVHGETAVLYEDPSVHGLVQAMEEFESMSFHEDAIRDNARRFGPERFLRELGDLLGDLASNGAAKS